MNLLNIIVEEANENHFQFVQNICQEILLSSQARGTGIAQRSPEYISKKIEEGKAIVAHIDNKTWVGFCYIETWSHGKYVANSGLIVSPEYRNQGVAKEIKIKAFELSRKKYPDAKLFGLTTGFAVMKINSELGYRPTPYSELTQDESFWEGCKSCVNHSILISKERKNCLCTAMLFDPQEEQRKKEKVRNHIQSLTNELQPKKEIENNPNG